MSVAAWARLLNIGTLILNSPFAIELAYENTISVYVRKRQQEYV
jgi:hypothetical protein